MLHSIPRPEHPQPQFERAAWENLNGQWQFAFDFGKSGFDRAGYSGYNIRGLESNRVGLDVDGIPLPDATGRP